MIAGIIFMKKRKKSIDPSLMESGAITIRPGGHSGSINSTTQISKSDDQPRLPATSPDTSNIPLLSKSTQIVEKQSDVTSSQQTSSTPTNQLPKLPPAQSQTQNIGSSEDIKSPTPMIATTPSPKDESSPVNMSYVQKPESNPVGPNQKNLPNIHLPSEPTQNSEISNEPSLQPQIEPKISSNQPQIGSDDKTQGTEKEN
jgi:hypothetical protein